MLQLFLCLLVSLPTYYSSYKVYCVSGNGGTSTVYGIQATSASIGYPYRITGDTTGAVYFSTGLLSCLCSFVAHFLVRFKANTQGVSVHFD